MQPIKPTSYSRDYEITDAMFGAFRSPGGMPFFWKLLGWATLLLTIIGVPLIPMAISSYVDLITAVFAAESGPDVAFATVRGMGRYLGVMSLYTIAYVAVIAIIRAAFFRSYFFGDLGGTFPFQFGSDEVRQGLSMLGFYALLALLVIGISLLANVPMALLIMVLFGEESVAGMVLESLGIILLYVGIIAAYIWFAVRFCTAGALTALRGKTHVLAARHVSRNRFWALFGSILVAGLIGYIVSYIAVVIGIMLVFPSINIGDIMTNMINGDPEATLDAIQRVSETVSFRIMTMISIVIVSAGYAFYLLLLVGPQAYFTHQWAGADPNALDAE